MRSFISLTQALSSVHLMMGLNGSMRVTIYYFVGLHLSYQYVDKKLNISLVLSFVTLIAFASVKK